MNRLLSTCVYLIVSGLYFEAAAQQPALPSQLSPQRALLDQYCVICHNQAIVNSAPIDNESLQTTQLRNLGLTLDTENVSNLAANPAIWEKVVNKLQVGVMPPPNYPRPDKDCYEGFKKWLESGLDQAAEARVDPGRTQAFPRLNQAEYLNAVRDLLDLEINVAELIPPDAPDQYGFDNNAEVLALSPMLVERYVSAAHKIAELAIGAKPRGASIKTYDVPLNLIHDDRLNDELPFGSRGGTAVNICFQLTANTGLQSIYKLITWTLFEGMTYLTKWNLVSTANK